ncbi:hypothetical protein [Allochromatium palmeri]|uniref:Uncharacterized protein n=1 Tax=Allochromatium palmeri TaxID=231048 RepID=A0A6N8ECH4_9GAMM|nr:hypothetical protein [Allochromatium palmeri]MTW21038.1 hypothetical protein [Allochromatium palmeri]
MPSSGPPIDTALLPHLMLPGATMDEVRSLALGAARSRGWTVRLTDSTNDRLVVERPADASILALATPGMVTAPGSMLEVTTLLKDDGGGLEVATLAEVVTPPYDGRPAARLDYTEQFRDPLMQSLESLRERWMRDRERLARAAPPPEGWKSAWEEPSTPETAPTTVADAVEFADDAETAQAKPPTPIAPAAASTSMSMSTPSTAPRVSTGTSVQSPLPQANTGSGIPIPTYARPAPEWKGPSPAPAPAVNTQVAARENMMSLPSTATTGARVLWSANAEQYARQRGCQVSAGGAQLIESRQDGEVHRVPCQGSDSFLIHCQDGLCQGLL